jgi:hypothetical protein
MTRNRRLARVLLGAAVAASMTAGCQPGSATSQGSGAPAPGATSAPSSPANADLYGTITFDDARSFTNPPGDPTGNGTDQSTVTVHVAMARVAGTNEFTDAGSTFSHRQTAHRDKLIGDPSCEGVSDTAGEATDKSFSTSVAPDDPGSEITVLYSPELKIFTLFVSTSLQLTTSINACMGGTAKSETHWGGGPLACGAFGLAGKATSNPTGPDQIDMACNLAADGGVITVSGTLTLKD